MVKHMRLWVGLILVFQALRPALAQSAAPDPAEWAPADAVAYFGVTDLDQLWADYQKTAGYALMKDTAASANLREFDLFGQGLEKFKQRLAKSLDTEANRLKSPFRGPLAFYVTVPSGDTLESAQFNLVIGVGNAELMKQYYSAAIRKLRQIAENYEAVSVGSHSIDVFTAKEKGKRAEGDEEGGEDEGDEEEEFGGGGPMGMGDEAISKVLDKAIGRMFSAEAMPPKLALCLTDDRLILASADEKGAPADQVKAALRQARGGESSLAGTEDHKALLRNFKPAGPVRFLLSLPRIFEIAKSKNDAGTREMMNVIGSNCLRSVIGHARLGDAGYDAKYEVLALMSGERAGLAKIFSMKNRDAVPVPSAPADTAFYAGVNLNPGQLLDEIERLTRQSNPEAAERMRAGMEAIPLGPDKTLNFRKDFLDHLSEPLSFCVNFTRPYSLESPQFAFSVAHRNKEAVDKVLGMLPAMTARDVRGTQVYDAALGGVSLAALSDRLVIGSSSALEAALRPLTEEDRLSAAPSFKRAAQLVPREAWGLVYVDWRRIMETAIGLAEKRKELTGGRPTIGTELSVMLLETYHSSFKDENFDQARKALKYYAPQIFAVATTPDGVRLTAIQLKAEKE